jgi:hypothetical protein
MSEQRIPQVGETWKRPDGELLVTGIGILGYGSDAGKPALCCRRHVAFIYQDGNCAGLSSGVCSDEFAGSATFIRSATPELPKQGEGPAPAVGQVWLTHGGAEHTIIGEHKDPALWETSYRYPGDSRSTPGSQYKTMRGCTLVRHAPSSPEQPKVPYACDGHRSFQPDCARCLEGKGVLIPQDLLAPAKPAPKPRTRETYETLYAKALAEDGVAELPKCGECGARVAVNQDGWCFACCAKRDDFLAFKMRITGGTTVPAEPPPWRPSVDPLFDVPDWDEFGTRGPR